MKEAYLRTANLMRSSPTLPPSNASLKKTNSELISSLQYALDNPSDVMDKIQDERTEYEVTTKLFFLPQSPQDAAYIHSCLSQVHASLGVEDVDLLILSFPNIVLDAEDTGIFEEADFARIKALYEAASELVAAGKVKALGVAEFSASRLEQLCNAVKIVPEVNQINLKDCCVTPRDLIVYGKKMKIKLFTHGDASDILPTPTLQDLLHNHANGEENGVEQVTPLWVCKYTAVASNRGVVENKGYIVALDR